MHIKCQEKDLPLAIILHKITKFRETTVLFSQLLCLQSKYYILCPKKSIKCPIKYFNCMFLFNHTHLIGELVKNILNYSKLLYDFCNILLIFCTNMYFVSWLFRVRFFAIFVILEIKLNWPNNRKFLEEFNRQTITFVAIFITKLPN